MCKVFFFGEDIGHEAFVGPLLRKVAAELEIVPKVQPFSATGGITRLHYEVEQFCSDLSRNKAEMPDIIVIATDSNCMGYAARKENIEKATSKFPEYRDLIVYAIPEPHVERWMLIDQAAFKRVLGKACKNPPVKCEKDLYKKLLLQSIRDAGRSPLIGGFEYAEEIVNEMDLESAQQNDAGIRKLIRDLRAQYKRVKG